MKKILLLILILLALFCAFTSCAENNEETCVHDFAPATCETPEICTLCGEPRGEASGHDFAPATCEAPMTCLTCGATEGEVIEHIWKNSTCLTLGTCQVCGATEERTLGHVWQETTICTEAKQCSGCTARKPGKEHTWSTDECLETPVCLECGFIGSEIQHKWAAASCISPKTCMRCNETSEEPLGHQWIVISCKNPKVCQRCRETSMEDLPHNWTYAGCDKERTCRDCYKKEGYVYGHNWLEPTCERGNYCDRCGSTVGEPLGHNWELVSEKETPCEGKTEVFHCDRCNENLLISDDNGIYGYHVCDTNGRCIQCYEQFDTSKMTLESVLLANEHSIKCCGVFSSRETSASIYKQITSSDVGMPIIDLGGSLPTAKGYTNVVEFTYESEGLSFDCTAEIKVQGASSAGKPKKNFNIKLFDADGSKHKVELCDGWGKENKYCMKANYIDYSQSRNVVSGKIFGEIVKSRNDELASTPNGGAIDGYPILVYNNGVFQGIYTMNIPKDKWMFDMHDSDEKNQAIFMTETWNNAVSFREISTSGFVLEYASNEDSTIDNSTQWAYDSMLDLIEFVYNNDGEDFKNGIHQYADIDKCIDSMIYTFFICADDNTSKNILWVTLDGKVWFSSMYDMDGTWGMRWNGNIEFNEYTHPISALVDGQGLAPERNHSNLNLLWERIYVNYYDRVCERYAELRQSILTVENITYHFEAFFDAIPDVVREAEKEKWTGVPSQSIDHLEQILTFAEKRIEVMDGILIP